MRTNDTKYVFLFLASLLIIKFCSRGTQREVKTLYKERGEHFKFPVHQWPHDSTCKYRDDREICKKCIIKSNLWDCVGSDRSWSVVFVDNRPKGKRAPNLVRLIRQSLLVVAHDTITSDSMHWPKNWGGRESIATKIGPGTTLIKGDLDRDGAAFKRATNLFKTSSQVQQLFSEYNPHNVSTGSHITLLASAVLATTGDVLELGTGFFSTPLLHSMVKSTRGSRTIVSTDTDASWLTLFMNLSSPFHQIRYVPVFEDGNTCGTFPGHSMEPVRPENLEFAGTLQEGLVSNELIVCPN